MSMIAIRESPSSWTNERTNGWVASLNPLSSQSSRQIEIDVSLLINRKTSKCVDTQKIRLAVTTASKVYTTYRHRAPVFHSFNTPCRSVIKSAAFHHLFCSPISLLNPSMLRYPAHSLPSFSSPAIPSHFRSYDHQGSALQNVYFDSLFISYFDDLWKIRPCPFQAPLRRPI